MVNLPYPLSSEIYGKVVVASKVPPPNERPQREVTLVVDCKATFFNIWMVLKLRACLIGGDPS